MLNGLAQPLLTGFTVGVEVTTPVWTDGELFEGLVNQVEGTITQIDADGAYPVSVRVGITVP